MCSSSFVFISNSAKPNAWVSYMAAEPNNKLIKFIANTYYLIKST